MASTSNNNQFDPQLYLTPNQQDLLLAALTSNNSNSKNNMFPSNQDAKASGHNSQMSQQAQFSVDSIDPNYFTSPQLDLQSSNFGGGFEDSPYGDFLDNEGFDFDNSEEGALMIGALPGNGTDKNGDESGDKRKTPGDDNEEADGSAKRREGEDKTAKKPGRKPLTSEPTTKRKAQNRAAQRAFRERKEKHLKDLETKVAELEKASDAANHENGLLRAQVQRLQTELREYRKRLSLNGAVSRSPPVTNGFSAFMNGAAATATGTNNFMFEFPRFGNIGTQAFDSGKSSISAASQASPQSAVPGVLARESTAAARSVSPRTQSTSSPANNPIASPMSSASPANRNGDVANMANVFGSSILGTTGSMLDMGLPASGDANQNGRSSIDSSSGQSRVFQFNSHSNSSVSNSNSPSASSMSQFGQNSSCETSPEPSHNSPGKANEANANKDAITKEGYVCHGNSEAPATNKSTSDVNGIDYFASQNGGQFDPLLFGDYRESQAAVIGDGDFTGGFFNDAFPSFDFGSPLNLGDSSTPMAQQEGGDDEVVPGEDPAMLLNCHKIWDKLASRQDFKDGTIDIDSLCTELRSKARCSESGVVVDHKDVEAALKRLPDSKRL